MKEQTLAVQQRQEYIEAHPRIQLEPHGERGYIEMRAVKAGAK